MVTRRSNILSQNLSQILNQRKSRTKSRIKTILKNKTFLKKGLFYAEKRTSFQKEKERKCGPEAR
jgi:hypothetical protein